MPLREEGMSLRLQADSASLKAGRREVQEWSKQVNELSKRIKTGLGTKEDFARLKEHQQSATKNYGELQTKLEAYSRQRERYLTQIGEAPTVGLRQEAKLRARDVRGMMRDISAQQGRLGGLGEAAGAGIGGAPVGGGFRRGVSGALGFARGLPMVGGMLAAGGLAAGILGAIRYNMQLEKSAGNVALAFAEAGDNVGDMVDKIKSLGAGRGFAPEVLVQAQAAGVMAGGRGMVGQMPFMARFAQLRGMDLPTLSAMMGQGVRGAGAFRPAGIENFLMRMEGARLAAPAEARMSTQQYMQTVLPFLQAQGKFQAYTGSSEDAINRLYTGVVRPGTTPGMADFFGRNLGTIAGGLSQAIRAPQGEAAQFFTMRALGLGEPGVSYYDVLQRQEQGLTEQNLQAYVGYARQQAKPYRGRRVGGIGEQEAFALAMRNLTGRAIPTALGEQLFGADLTSDKTLRDSLTKKGKDEFEALIIPPDVKAAQDIHAELQEIRKRIGDFFDKILPVVAGGLDATNVSIEFWGEALNKVLGGGAPEWGQVAKYASGGRPMISPARPTKDNESR